MAVSIGWNVTRGHKFWRLPVAAELNQTSCWWVFFCNFIFCIFCATVFLFFSCFLWIACLKSISQLSNLRMTHAIYNKCPPDINVTEHSASYTKASFLFIKQYRITILESCVSLCYIKWKMRQFLNTYIILIGLLLHYKLHENVRSWRSQSWLKNVSSATLLFHGRLENLIWREILLKNVPECTVKIQTNF